MSVQIFGCIKVHTELLAWGREQGILEWGEVLTDWEREFGELQGDSKMGVEGTVATGSM